jgi:hypothetical protein
MYLVTSSSTASGSITFVLNTAADPGTLQTLFARSTFDSSTGCKTWQGSRSSQGRYGTIWHNGTCEFVHRVAFRAAYGELPAGSLDHESNSVEVHHVCGNRLCVEPTHLEVITRRRHAVEHKAMREAARFALAA